MHYLRDRYLAEASEPRKYEVRKDGSKWHLYRIMSEWPHEKLVLKFPSKTMADLFAKALEGDDAAAKKWYRLDVARNLKQKYIYKTPQEAWKASAQTAHLFGFSPSHVNANKDTGEPLGEAINKDAPELFTILAAAVKFARKKFSPVVSVQTVSNDVLFTASSDRKESLLKAKKETGEYLQSRYPQRTFLHSKSKGKKLWSLEDGYDIRTGIEVKPIEGDLEYIATHGGVGAKHLEAIDEAPSKEWARAQLDQAKRDLKKKPADKRVRREYASALALAKQVGATS